ncbi:MAG: hypothetical protein NVSMB48_23720 [Marmoricola sp.]
MRQIRKKFRRPYTWRDAPGDTGCMVNPFRFACGGRPYSLSFAVGPADALRAIQPRVADGITDAVEGFLQPRKASHPLAGHVGQDGIYLYTPRYARWPLWPLSPVFRGRLVPTSDGGSRLEGRMFIRRWRALIYVLVTVALILFAPSPLAYVGYVFLIGAGLQFVLVLQETTTELANRIQDVSRSLAATPALVEPGDTVPKT